MHASTVRCLLVRCPSEVCACPHAVHHTPTCYREDKFRACMYAGPYICMLPLHSACFCAISRRSCSHARQPYIIAFTRYREDIFYACMLDARYVRCRRVLHARAMSARYSCSHARPPFMNARSSVARCSMWLHPCLYVVKYLHASRGPNIHCSRSHTDVHICSTLVGIMCMLPSCSEWSCPRRVADHPRTPDICSSASVVVAFLLARQM